MNSIHILPRLIRLRDAFSYLGMDRERFNTEVRPTLTEIPIGKQGVAFDRLDLDAWVEDYKTRSGRPAVDLNRSKQKWDAKNRQASLKEASTGTLKNKSTDSEFEKVLEQCLSKRRKGTSVNS